MASHIRHNDNRLISSLAPANRDGYLFQIGKPQGVLYHLDRSKTLGKGPSRVRRRDVIRPPVEVGKH
jgi:hypothetical protein